MAYFMRFVSLDPRPLSLPELETALKAVDAKYSIRRSENNAPIGELRFGRSLFALLNVSKDDEDIAELREAVGQIEGETARRVHQILERATDVLTVEVKWQGRSTGKTLRMIDPMWEWLNAHRRGLVQADGEGFYEGKDLLIDLRHVPRRVRKGQPCPHCGKPLRTEHAKQCFGCGADWH
jgi:hypothetical protein